MLEAQDLATTDRRPHRLLNTPSTGPSQLDTAQTNFSGLDNPPGHGVQDLVGPGTAPNAMRQQGQLGQEVIAPIPPATLIHGGMEMES